MAAYIRLLTFTQKGIEALKDQATNFSAVNDVVEANGGKLAHAWVCQGRYDIVDVKPASLLNGLIAEFDELAFIGSKVRGEQGVPAERIDAAIAAWRMSHP